jgi:glycosyltransferase involved in cell wall biosynthesis
MLALQRSTFRSPEPCTVAGEAAQITVCIVCRNEADRLGPCLDSVTWAHEVIVMDLSSTDGSVALSKQHGARVVHHAPVPIVELVRNDVAALASNDWILVLDPDERVLPGLARELARVAHWDHIDAVVIPRMNFDLGYSPSTPLHRYERQLRMYRRSKVQWPLIPNALPSVPDERVYLLPQRDELVLIHDRSRNIPEVLERVIRYAPAQAQSMIDQGQRFTAKAMMLALAGKAYRQFILGKPWRDGVPGLLRATMLVNFHFYVWAAFWQLSGARRTGSDDRLLRQLGFLLEMARLPMRVLVACCDAAARALRTAKAICR